MQNAQQSQIMGLCGTGAYFSGANLLGVDFETTKPRR